MKKPPEERKLNALAKKKEGIELPVPDISLQLPDDYSQFLQGLKNRIKTERIKSLLSANAALVMLYWDIGRAILEKQNNAGWGAKIIDRMAYDLHEEFPDMRGFSTRNLKDMRKFAECWSDREIVQRTAAQIPWRNNQLLLYKIKESDIRIWYAEQNRLNGWSRDILSLQIESNLHKRIGQSANNFEVAFPRADSDMVNQIFKDPYVFDFLGTADTRRERELENKLMEHLEKFLLELGQGFAFVGRQVHLEFSDEDYYIDLLFYHLKLRCYVVIELKSGKFDPGYVSKL
ncbi:MAG: DUF1016 family protein, partial [Desulfamplus sp.]|nr:DUF1016 family protein [Desulfamplus sp.]